MSFEWLVGEEENVDDGDDQPSGRKGRLRFVVLALLLVGALLFAAYRTVDERVQRAQAQARGEVLAAHSLLTQAVNRGDGDLFESLLGDGRAWRSGQQLAFSQGLVIGRASMGLNRQRESDFRPDVTLEPDLEGATLVATVPYTGTLPAVAQETVFLRHVLRYEKQGARWRWTAHGDDFWGDEIVDEDGNLRVVYPERDAALGARLAGDVRRRLPQICGAFEGCPQERKLQLRLMDDPISMVSPITDRDSQYLTINLPAPSLVGVPLDETGYRALRDGYLRTVIQQLLWLIPGAVEAQGGAWHTLLQRVLVDLQLAPWPPPGAPEQAPALSQDVQALCVSGVESGATLYRYRAGARDWEVELGGRDLVKMAPVAGRRAVALQEGRRREGDDGPRILLWRQGRIQTILEGLRLSHTDARRPTLYAFDEDQTFMGVSLAQLSSCRGSDCDFPVVEGSMIAWSPDESRVLVRREVQGSRSMPGSDEMFFLGDQRGDDLSLIDLGTSPFWLDNTTYGYVRLLRRPSEQVDTDYEVIVADLAARRSRILTTGRALERLLPQDAQDTEGRLIVSDVLTHPAHPDTLFVIVSSTLIRFTSSSSGGSVFLFAVDRRSGRAEHLLSLQRQQVEADILLSTGGDWLAFSGRVPATGAVGTFVYDVAGGSLTTYASPDSYARTAPVQDWSAESEQLLVADGGLLRIFTPGEEREQALALPVPGCAFVAWANS